MSNESSPGAEESDVVSTPPHRKSRGRGRPRDDSRTETVLKVVVDLIGELGFERMRVQDIAERAGVGLATLYRRWPTKADLVVAAITRYPLPFAKPEGSDAQTSVDSILETQAIGLADPRVARRALLAALTDEPEITAIIRSGAMSVTRNELRQVVAGVVGNDRDDLDLLVDLGPALIWYRLLVVGDTSDPVELARRVTELVLGAHKQQGPHPRSPVD